MRTERSLSRDLQIRPFGRKGVAVVTATSGSTLGSDLKLFALTFVGGFLFMTVFLA
jgi:hypothetical protein